MLARSYIKEVKEIRAKTPEDLELELFVHGAMCISYSGRCLLSNYMAQGMRTGAMCTSMQMEVLFNGRKETGEYMPVYENYKEHLFIIQVCV